MVIRELKPTSMPVSVLIWAGMIVFSISHEKVTYH